MRRRPWALIFGGAFVLCACAGPPESSVASTTPLDSLCLDTEGPVSPYGEIFWGIARREEPELYRDALDLCTFRCPDAVNCGPLLAVGRFWEREVSESALPESESSSKNGDAS